MANSTINDVAALAGVSIKTVSRVVNGEPNVAESTRARVEDAVARLNYRPSKSARNLASRRSHLIGLVYDDPARYENSSSGYVIKLQQGALAACKARNFDLLIHPCAFDKKQIGREIRALIEHSRLDGLILAPPVSDRTAVLRAAAETATPVVRIAPGTRGKGDIVRTNDRRICADMVRYLASLGHRRIAFIRGNPEHKAVARRTLGYQDGLRETELPMADELQCQGDNSIASGERCGEQLLSLDRPPTAIFASNDDMAAGVLRVAHRRGIRVPEELSVAGFDDIALANQIFPALTTINQPLDLMAEQATELVISSITGRPLTHDPQLIEAELVIRDSTGPAPD